MTEIDPVHRVQVVASEASLLQAVKTNDVDLLASLLHDDLLFNGPTGQTATKADDLKNYRSGGIHIRTADSSDMLMSAIGGDVIVAVTVHLVGNYMGQEIDGRFRYLRVWKQLDGRWQVIGGSVIPLGIGGA